MSRVTNSAGLDSWEGNSIVDLAGPKDQATYSSAPSRLI
jgi:hypothetical protein